MQGPGHGSAEKSVLQRFERCHLQFHLHWWHDRTGIVGCWISVNQGAAFLAHAAISIVDSTKWCHPSKQGKDKGRLKCSIDVVGLLGALGLAARFLSLAVPACQGPFISGDAVGTKARCAADISGVVAGIFAATAPAMGLKQTCGHESTLQGDPAAVLPEWNRRLRESLNSTVFH
mmetsp:Transcript_79639/g.215381  ORF Transcript_79639/g.215381 Transcript_79639/m.215381 type:complete len:175 (-) Transcript_79639:131-655(-)